MAAAIKDRLGKDLQAAMRARDQVRVTALRMWLAAVRQQEIDSRTTLDDAGSLAQLDRLVRQYRDAIRQYRRAGRDESAAREEAELSVLESYLPPPLSESALEELIRGAIAEAGASSVRDMGRVMKILRPGLQGRADMAQAADKVRQLLG